LKANRTSEKRFETARNLALEFARKPDQDGEMKFRQNKIMLLGSGELGKELTISLKRLGQTVIAVDRYAGAPAMQVADSFEVVNMLGQ
jgi:formate-dependent phosphoribosylglycinamide formyltransferase (GAR transformylase)